MHISKGKDVDPQLTKREMFTGDVYQHAHVGDVAKSLRINLVKFAPGGRTKWHKHPFEQGLIIVEGKGIVATEDKENVVEPGDVVFIPIGEKHWHGGSATTGMAHIAINQDGESTVMEPVEEVKTKVD